MTVALEPNGPSASLYAQLGVSATCVFGTLWGRETVLTRQQETIDNDRGMEVLALSSIVAPL